MTIDGNLKLYIFRNGAEKYINMGHLATWQGGIVPMFDDSLFLFCGTRNDRFKGLYWDGEGFILLYKRFENGGLRWTRHRSVKR